MSDDRPIKGWRPLLPEGITKPPSSSLASLESRASPGLAPQPGEPPRYERAPRRYVPLPDDVIEIQGPALAPSPPQTSSALFLLPASVATISGIVLLLLLATGYYANGLFLVGLVIAASVFLTSLGVVLYGSFHSKKEYQQEMESRERDYRSYLATRRQTLEALYHAQLNAIWTTHPDPAECRRRAELSDPATRLWERTSADTDFLDLRLGTGHAPAAYSIQGPSTLQFDTAPDELLSEAQDLCAAFTQINGAAISLPLAQLDTVEIAGHRDAIQSTLRALLLQIATHHAPSDVKIVLIFPESDLDTWAWARWLPHVWDDERKQRYMASGPDEAYRLITALYDLLKRRYASRWGISHAPSDPRPAFVFVVADGMLFSNSRADDFRPFLDLLADGAEMGLHTVFCHAYPVQLQAGCSATIDLFGSEGQLHLVGSSPWNLTFTPDSVDSAQAERFARTLAPLWMEPTGGMSPAPPIVTTLDLFGVERVENLPVQQNWQKNAPLKSLSVPLGHRAGGGVAYLNLHSRAHGPNGLVAGATGTGKSNLIQSLMLSLAICFSPRDLSFVLLDFSNDQATPSLQALPHMATILTNPEMDAVRETLTLLEAELEHRASLFRQVNVNHIDDYKELSLKHKVSEEFPYVILIVDEFPALKKGYPNSINRLGAIATKGNPLGFSVILATRDPHGRIPAQIKAGSRFRFCFRVDQKEDSIEIIEQPDAVGLKSPGLAWFRAGENEILDLWQIAWSSAPYPSGNDPKENDSGVAEVRLNGDRRILTPPTRITQTGSPGSQLDAIARHLGRIAKQMGLTNPPRLLSLPVRQEIPLEQIRPAEGWNGKTWQTPGTWLAPVIGAVDDPQQQQKPLRLDLGEHGHSAIYGAREAETKLLLHALVVSLALSHSPRELNLYLLNFDRQELGLFKLLPHMGGVIELSETGRLQYLVQLLERELSNRKDALSRTGLGTWQAYFAAVPDASPATVVIVNDFAELSRTQQSIADTLLAFAHQSNNLGMHLVCATNTASDISNQTKDDFALTVRLGVPPTENHRPHHRAIEAHMRNQIVLGRSQIRDGAPVTFQVVLPVAGNSESERRANIARLFATMATEWEDAGGQFALTRNAPMPLCELMPPSNRWSDDRTLAVPICVSSETAQPFAFDLTAGPHFLITGPPNSGKTIFLQSWVLAMTEHLAPSQLELYLVDPDGKSLLPFSNLPHVRVYVKEMDDLSDFWSVLGTKLEERQRALEAARPEGGKVPGEAASFSALPALVLVMDAYEQFVSRASEASKATLEQWLRKHDLEFFTLIAGQVEKLRSDWESLTKTIKDSQTGILLGTTERTNSALFGIELPASESNKPIYPGAGYYARRGLYQAVKCATPHEGKVTLMDWTERIRHKVEP
ncbi:MAG: type VII secretion protein EssC [Anaerolineae bacterium]|nr:type VII secretion protein EssC [Anaerolineae bacterium]